MEYKPFIISLDLDCFYLISFRLCFNYDYFYKNNDYLDIFYNDGKTQHKSKIKEYIFADIVQTKWTGKALLINTKEVLIKHTFRDENGSLWFTTSELSISPYQFISPFPDNPVFYEWIPKYRIVNNSSIKGIEFDEKIFDTATEAEKYAQKKYKKFGIIFNDYPGYYGFTNIENNLKKG